MDKTRNFLGENRREAASGNLPGSAGATPPTTEDRPCLPRPLKGSHPRRCLFQVKVEFASEDPTRCLGILARLTMLSGPRLRQTNFLPEPRWHGRRRVPCWCLIILPGEGT